MSYTGNKLVNPTLELPYQLLDTVQNTGQPMGFHKATGLFQFINVIGFKMAFGNRIKNCTITIPNLSYSATFGVSSNWDLVGYFPTSDINITAEGIGRSGSNNLGGGWSSDVCGFYLNIPSQTILDAKSVIIEYEFSSPFNGGGGMKHGIGFFPSTSQPTGADGGINFRYIGTWDNAAYFNLPTLLTSIAYTNRSSSFVANVTYKRKTTIKNNIQ